MPNFILRTQAGYLWPEQPYIHNKARVEVEEDLDEIWLVDWHTDPVAELGIPGGLLIGGWNRDGGQPLDPGTDLPLYPIDPLYYTLRPLGNFVDGLATGQLRYTYPAGYGQVNLRVDGLYPTENDAMGVEVRHWEDTTPGWEGWGWRAEIIYAAEQRPPDARAIGIYSDPECLSYLYTTGAFILQDSDWQVDEEGNPFQVWANNNPAGRATTEQAPIHHALLFGAAQEGHYTLQPGQVGSIRNYWEVDQGAAQRAAFIAAIDAVAGIQARENSFNRVIFRWRNTETRLTWAQIVNTPMNQVAEELRNHIIRVAIEVGLTRAAQTP